MVLILLSWIYILFTVINIGYITQRLFRIKTQEFTVTAFLGLISATITAGIWAFFGRLNLEFHVFLMLINLITLLSFRKQVFSVYTDFTQQIRSLSQPLKLLFTINIILILAQSASAPFILDNESYYLQTIKWLNEYGYVKGLANLHLFFGQQSGWHLAQSAFSFSFLYSSFNDLSGFCLVLGNIFAFGRLKESSISDSENALIIGLMPVANVLLLQFVSAPSPDLPIYVLSFVIVFYFVESFKTFNTDRFPIIALLAMFAIFIKPTAVVLVLFPMILLFKNFKSNLPSVFRILLAGSIFGFLFLAKNYVTSGHPLFPIVWSTDATFAVPNEIVNFYYMQTKLFGFRISESVHDKMSAYELFITWLQLPKLHGVFNSLMVIIMVLVPVFIYKLKNRAWWFVYAAMVVQMIILANSSPQYRFFLNFILVFGCMFLALLISKKYLIAVLGTSTLVAAIFTLISFDLGNLTNNPANAASSTIAFENLIFPHKNSKADLSFERTSDGKLDYYTPVDHYFFWGSGDGPLPCVNHKQIEYFKKHFRVVPQPLGNELHDGFYARKLSPIE